MPTEVLWIQLVAGVVFALASEFVYSALWVLLFHTSPYAAYITYCTFLLVLLKFTLAQAVTLLVHGFWV